MELLPFNFTWLLNTYVLVIYNILFNCNYFSIPGVILNLHGLVRKESIPFHLSNGECCLHQMGNSMMVELDFWKKSAVGLVSLHLEI